MVKAVMKQGTASVGSARLMSFSGCSIRKPTRNRTQAVAAAGMVMKSGERKRAARKSMATVKEVMPVRPPATTPAELSA